MSMTKIASLPPSLAAEMRQFWGRMFGSGIQAHRERAGISIEEAAGLSGMTVSEWMAIEDGHVPQDVNRLRAMAARSRCGTRTSLLWPSSARERGRSNRGVPSGALYS